MSGPTTAVPGTGVPAPAAGVTVMGVGVGRRAVIGPVVQVHEFHRVAGDTPVVRDGVPVPPEEVGDAVAASFAAVSAELTGRAERAEGSMAHVLAATAQIAADPALIAGAKRELTLGKPGVTAVETAIGTFIDMFTAAGGLMAERVTDLRSVRDRVVAHLVGAPPPGVPELPVPSIVIARDLAPADTAALDLEKVLAIVTEQGGPTGHTAIIAGQLGLPCVVQVPGATSVVDGTVVLVDARTGTFQVEPPPYVASSVAERARAEHALDSDNAPGATADGHPVDLLANIGTAEDAERAAACDDARVVAGSGLFRTEVLFLDSVTAPTVDAQAAVYERAIAAFGGRKVVVRTLDAGADKPLAFATLAGEENPALGVRGYRIGRVHPHLMTDQLTALGRAAAAAGTQPWVMAPMIATAQEAREFAQLARDAGLTKVGVMIEVPAAALRARSVLREVDFASIGTNDMAQYTMATDRLQGELADLLDKWQPAVLDLVAQVARAGLELDKPVGVCGESAGDPLMALVLTGLGVRSLSMSLGSIPAVRYALRNHTRQQCAEMAEAALRADSPAGARDAVAELLEPGVRDLLV